MKFTKENLPAIAKSYYGDKQTLFLEAANFAYDLAENEATAIFVGMLAVGEDRNATSRARILNQKSELETATELAIQFADKSELTAEIFSAGTWNKRWKFATTDLDQIVASFNELQAVHKVPLKLGHNEEQPITDGQPALGWVTSVWRQGDKLMAKFAHIPPVVRKAMEAKMYRHVSIELDVDVKDHKGKKHKFVLSAVALLGADRPAVNNLADLDTYLESGAQFSAASREVFSTINGSRFKEIEMNEADVQAAIDKALRPLSDQVKALGAENSALKAENERFKASAAESEAKFKADKLKSKREGVLSKLEDAVKKSIFTPAQREAAIKFMRIDDENSLMSLTDDMVDEYVKVNGGKIKMSNEQGRGQGQGDNQGKGYDDPGAEVTRLAELEKLKNSKLSFAQARDIVLSSNRELAMAWMGETTE